jgi:hypothetical protein
MHPLLDIEKRQGPCSEVILALEKCHEENRVGRYLFACDAFASALNKCLTEQRDVKVQGNLEKGRNSRNRLVEAKRRAAAEAKSEPKRA